MIERAIENWLTNTNERNYQIAFCQVLLQTGHRIIYVSRHGAMEQGKDLITIGSDGDCYAYQLKTGNIDLGRWRQILGEIKELMELPVVHPSVDKTKVHKSYIVTNGDISDEVRIQIDQINDDNQRKCRGYSYLDLINGQTLLQEFIDAQGEFLPTELKHFDLFLNLFLADGTDFLLKEKYFDFFDTIFSNIPNQKSNAVHAISSSIIIASYLLSPYQIKNNHYAQFEAWTSLAACIVRYARRVGLEEEDWTDSLSLMMSQINENLFYLRKKPYRGRIFSKGIGWEMVDLFIVQEQQLF
jgi:hypothetical protein